jgi:hypothetical protein
MDEIPATHGIDFRQRPQTIAQSDFRAPQDAFLLTLPGYFIEVGLSQLTS